MYFKPFVGSICILNYLSTFLPGSKYAFNFILDTQNYLCILEKIHLIKKKVRITRNLNLHYLFVEYYSANFLHLGYIEFWWSIVRSNTHQNGNSNFFQTYPCIQNTEYSSQFVLFFVRSEQINWHSIISGE